MTAIVESPRETYLATVKEILGDLSGVRPWGGSYPNTPRIIADALAFTRQNYHPSLAVLEAGGSQIAEADHDGGEDDRFRFDIYGQTATKDSVLARVWASRLRYDCAKTLRAATRAEGALTESGIVALSIEFGEEELGYDDTHADFVLPCTARLAYTLELM